MKHWVALVAVAFATLGLVACGENGDEATTSAVEQAASEDAQAAEEAAEETQEQVQALEKELAKQERELEQEQQEPDPEPAPEPASEPEPEPAEPPDVVGLTLPAAKRLLSEAGFKADVSNTDAAFGILVPQNYTICEQSPPRGDLVPILAQKEGC